MAGFRGVGHVVAVLLAAGIGLAAPWGAGAGERMERILSAGTLTLGYRADAPPFSVERDGRARGFSVELCIEIGRQMKAGLGLEDFSARLVRVDTTDRFDAIARGEVDLLCGATTATLARRETVSFSIPTFATGVGAAVSASASDLLKEVLITNSPAAFSAAATREALSGKRIGVRSGTTAADWLAGGRIAEMTGTDLVEVADHADGMAMVAAGDLDVYFADRAILIGTLRLMDMQDGLVLSQKSYTNEPYAIAIPRGDEDLRLAVDTALSRIYRSGTVFEILERHFGTPSAEMAFFYAAIALPE